VTCVTHHARTLTWTIARASINFWVNPPPHVLGETSGERIVARHRLGGPKRYTKCNTQKRYTEIRCLKIGGVLRGAGGAPIVTASVHQVTPTGETTRVVVHPRFPALDPTTSNTRVVGSERVLFGGNITTET
jgi:hypothetical protein